MSCLDDRTMCSRIGEPKWCNCGWKLCVFNAVVVTSFRRITLGNQLDGIRLVDTELIDQFQKRYPDGNCMAPPLKGSKP